MSVYDGASYSEFKMTVDFKSNEDLGSNAFADVQFYWAYQDANNFDGFELSNFLNSSVIYQVVDGVVSEIEYASGDLLSDNDWHEMIVQYNDGVLSVTIDDDLKLSEEMTTSGGKVGFGGYNDSASFDDVTIQDLSSPESNTTVLADAGTAAFTGVGGTITFS